MAHSPVILIVLDGFGYRSESQHNAIAQAKTPFFDYLGTNYPWSLLDASGTAVGLPAGQMGNSEVGHLTIGAGKPIDTDIVRINKSIASGTFGKNEVLQKLFNHVKKNHSTLHLKGLVSPGGIHSHSDHLYAILRAAKAAGVENVAIHAFTDGRDTPPMSSHTYLAELEAEIEKLQLGHIASVSGRYYAMDRDNNWDRLERATEVLFHGQGKSFNDSPSKIISTLHAQGVGDEHFEPMIFLDDTGKSYPLRDNDGVFFFNFRADRARMLSKKIIDHAKDKDIYFATLTNYDDTLDVPVAFPPEKITTTLASEISRAGLLQVHIAETEKYAHATYFLNGGHEKPNVGEKHVLIPSRKDVATHDQAPEMRAKEITDAAIKELNKGTNFIFINYANADMVGHTANFPAALRAIETLDTELARLVAATDKKGGVVFITADHGNAELMVDQTTGHKHTAHTSSPVPAMLTSKQYTLKNGTLADVAPTILQLLGLSIPVSMQGKILLS